MLPGIILAAGDSTRMGSPKAVLQAPDGDSFVVRIIRTLHTAGVAELVVITGKDHDAIVDAIARSGLHASLRIERNPDPSRGQLSSLLVGMAAVVTPSTEGLLMTLVDVPMVKASTVTDVIAVWRRTRAPIVRPAIGDRHGHPVIFDRAVLDELRRAPMNEGAKSVVRAHATEIVNVSVADEGCLMDIDTPSDYDAARKK
ncbi:MAG TPA: nucleotidyltransferase family protein [Vicinamibacterales bacterium]|nr:nucleotidyltransferase family protein [Vicinamibacterales bacterium]